MSVLVLVLALGLSMDAVAVSVAQGLRLVPQQRSRGIYMALCFGLFQGLMPLIGWALGSGAASWLQAMDHWVAFGLLTLIGGKMLWEGVRGDCDTESKPLTWRRIFTLAIATSIDALAVGFSLALLDVSPWAACLSIALVTAALSLVALLVARRLGACLGRGAEVCGGLILCGIGLRIVLEHTA